MKKGEEREIKLRVPDAELLKSLEKDPLFSGGSWKSVLLASVYFDFADRRLFKAGASLRFRSENGEGHVTLKTGGGRVGGVFCRRELEVVAGSIAEGVELLRRDGDAAELLSGGGELFPRARAEFLRRELCCTLFGAEIAMALDSGWLGGEDNAFCELEAELLSGDGEALVKIEKYLSEKYSLAPEPRSKRARCEEYGTFT